MPRGYAFRMAFPTVGLSSISMHVTWRAWRCRICVGYVWGRARPLPSAPPARRAPGSARHARLLSNTSCRRGRGRPSPMRLSPTDWPAHMDSYATETRHARAAVAKPPARPAQIRRTAFRSTRGPVAPCALQAQCTRGLCSSPLPLPFEQHIRLCRLFDAVAVDDDVGSLSVRPI